MFYDRAGALTMQSSHYATLQLLALELIINKSAVKQSSRARAREFTASSEGTRAQNTRLDQKNQRGKVQKKQEREERAG